MNGADFLCYNPIKFMAKQKRPHTYARNRSKSSELFNRKGREKIYENDSAFFTKLVAFVILSALWVRLKNPMEIGVFSVQAVPADRTALSLKNRKIPI